MKRRAPVKPSSTSDPTTKLSHLKKMLPKIKRAVANDVSNDRGAPVAQVEGQEDFHKVYRPRGGGYGAGNGDIDVEVND